MSLFGSPEEHAANPPSSWTVEKWGYKWHLCVNGNSLDSFTTKREAERAKTQGFHANLYEKERRWYAGEKVDGWKMYSECLSERQPKIG